MDNVLSVQYKQLFCISKATAAGDGYEQVVHWSVMLVIEGYVKGCHCCRIMPQRKRSEASLCDYVIG